MTSHQRTGGPAEAAPGRPPLACVLTSLPVFCRARDVHRAQAAFITAVEADPALQPLLGAEAVGKEGLEYAVAYVAPSARNVAVMTQFDEAAKL